MKKRESCDDCGKVVTERELGVFRAGKKSRWLCSGCYEDRAKADRVKRRAAARKT